MLQPSRRRGDAKAAGAPHARKAPGAAHLRLHTEVQEAEIAGRVQRLLGKIQDRTALVGIVGMGYVGLPFAVEKAKVGFKVVGIDQNADRAARINRGENYIPDV